MGWWPRPLVVGAVNKAPHPEAAKLVLLLGELSKRWPVLVINIQSKSLLYGLVRYGLRLAIAATVCARLPLTSSCSKNLKLPIPRTGIRYVQRQTAMSFCNKEMERYVSA